MKFKEHCPVCNTDHFVPDLKFDENGKGYHDMVNCTCGAILKTIVPIFKVTDSGYQFINVATDKKEEDT